MFNLFTILIAKNVTADATSLATLDDGEIVVFKQDQSPMTAGETISDSENFAIVQGTTSSAAIWSPWLQGRNIRVWKGNAYTAPVEQVSYVGYNGSTGSIDFQNETTYMLAIEFTQDLDLMQERQIFARYYYTTDSTATEDEISNFFVAAVNADPFAKRYVIAAELTSGTNRGIRLTGLAQTHGSYSNYQQVRFETTFSQTTQAAGTPVDEFGRIVGTSTAGVSVGPSQGIGTYDLVLDIERVAKGWRGFSNRTEFPVIEPPTYAVSGTTYDMYTIEYDITVDSTMAGVPHTTSKAWIVIAVPTGANSVQSYLEGVLNPYMLSTPRAFSPVNL